jgi:hypothetical protein
VLYTTISPLGIICPVVGVSAMTWFIEIYLFLKYTVPK